MPSDRTWERLVCEDCGEPYSGQPPLDCVHGRCNPQRAAPTPSPSSEPATVGREAAEHVYRALKEWDKNIFLDDNGLDHLGKAISDALPRPVVDVDQIVTFIEQGLRKAWSKDVRGSAKAVMPVIERVLRTELAAMPTAGVLDAARVVVHPQGAVVSFIRGTDHSMDAYKAAQTDIYALVDALPKKGKPCESAD